MSRRSLRNAQVPPSAPATSKRKSDLVAAESDINKLLKLPKSKLTTKHLPDIINPSSWEIISSESRSRLSQFLPPTAFADYQKTLDPDHPSRVRQHHPQPSPGSHYPDLVLPVLFTDPHFLAAARTFQDHLYSGWLKDEFKANVSTYQEGIRNGSLAAPWKDEEWDRDHPRHDLLVVSPAKSRKSSKASTADLRLVVQVGDIISYRHNFAANNVLVEKDVLVHSINTDRSITVLMESGTVQHLPQYLLIPGPPDPVPPIQGMDVSSPGMLETGILDLDGRVERAKRPNGNAWKAFTVYRRRDDSWIDNNKGGRQQSGTLHYLRSTIH
ncbi:hypothetical protein D9757_000074 [Collybiopsis confluens]|uniref:ASX DEUBAD domain-containing protein n=1 Tax=Collybiopsis confluens TaxID=2823264 RepID=A0A8H5MHL4_9AGAR|nr:hypothetical protein D9757_000074 [Collybiopsis confluens]